MEIVEQILEYAARAKLRQRPQAESQLRENFLTGPTQGVYANTLKDIEIVLHGDFVMDCSQPAAKWPALWDDTRLASVGAYARYHLPYIMESHRGVVSEVLGNQVEITYETPAGPLKQIYSREQFVGGTIPNEGDDVEAKVTVTVVDRETNLFEEDFESDIPSFEGRAIKGQARI